MGIFLRQSYNVKPLRWGSPADIEYAIKVNAEKVYDVDPDSIVLAMPLFWGLPCLDYSGKRNDGVNHGAYYKDGALDFDGGDYLTISDSSSFDSIETNNKITLDVWINLYDDQGPATPNFRTMISRGPHTGAHTPWIFVWDHVSDQLEFVIDHGARRIVRNSNLSFDTPYIVTAVYDGSDLIIYKDGAQLGTKQNEAIGLGGATNNIVGIGYDYNSGNDKYFRGIINEVRISNTAHTADQIALFHALPYGLYQPVIRRYYSIPMPPYVFTKNLSDTINLSDSISSKNIGLNKADTISLSDSIAKKPGLNKADTISLSDSIAKTFSFSKADTINMTDSIIKTFGLNKNDTITLSDLMIKGFGLNKTDTITLSDSITKAFGLSLSDTINLSDSILSKNIGALLDFIAKNKTFNFIAKAGG